MLKTIGMRSVTSAITATAMAATCVAMPAAVRAAEPQTVEERIQAMEDYIAIEQLLMRYAAALNTGDADAYVALFTPDAEFELKRDVDEPAFLGPFIGRDALREQWFPDRDPANEQDEMAGRRFGPMRHVTTNYEIDVDGEAAIVRAFFMEVVSNGDNSPPGSKPPTVHAMGRYEDELVKRDGRWLFSKRTVITDMNEAWTP